MFVVLYLCINSVLFNGFRNLILIVRRPSLSKY